MKTPRALEMQSSFLGRFSPHFAISTLRVVRYSRPRVLPALDFRVSRTAVVRICFLLFLFFSSSSSSSSSSSFFKVVTKNKEIFSLSMFFPGGGRPVGEDPSEKLRREQKREMEERRRRRGGRAMSTSTTTKNDGDILFEKKNHHFHREKSRRRRRRRDDDALFSVLWKADLICRVEDVAAKRGIRTRRNDKIQVPASALRTLERCDRCEGAPFFYVKKGASLSKTDDEKEEEGRYCAALDYQAEENTVVVPSELAKRLGLSTSSSSTSFDDGRVLRVEFRSRELEKCEWVKLQPVSNEFSKFLTRHPEADVKVALEQILVQWSCVHVGDAFEVDFSGFVSSREDEDASTKTFTLKVVALKVEGGEEDIVASLIETDVEVDLAPSIEHDEVIERIETLNRNDEEQKRNEREKKLAEAKEARVRLERKEERKEKMRRFREAMAKKLPSEPPLSTSSNVLRIRISLPTGEAIERRFYDTDDVSLLFDFVSASYSFDNENDDDDDDTNVVEFCLVTRGGFGVGENQKRIYMPSIASLGARGSLGAAGVRSGDVFFVEKVAMS